MQERTALSSGQLKPHLGSWSFLVEELCDVAIVILLLCLCKDRITAHQRDDQAMWFDL